MFNCFSRNNFWSFREKGSTPHSRVHSLSQGYSHIWSLEDKGNKYTSSVLHLETLLAGIPATVGRSLLCCSQRKGRHGIGDLKERKTADRRCACGTLGSSRAPVDGNKWKITLWKAEGEALVNSFVPFNIQSLSNYTVLCLYWSSPESELTSLLNFAKFN